MKDLIFFLGQNAWLTAIISSLTGYLLGSFSNARLIYRIVKKTTEYEMFREKVVGTDQIYESDLKSASWVGKTVGKKYGCLTSILDMIKVGVPTLAVKLLFPDQPFYLILAFFGVLGHNFPVYYRFKGGGRGESPMIGALLVIDWPGFIISNLASTVVGFIVGSVLVLQLSWKLLIIFWFWFVRHDYQAIIFIIVTNILFFYSLRKEIKLIWDLKSKKGGLKMSEEDYTEGAMMGRKMGRIIENYSVVGIIKRLRRKNT